MKPSWKYVKMEGEISNSAFIFYLSQLLAYDIFHGDMPTHKDLEFIEKQFEKKGWLDYYERIFKNY